jgi:hypothetical protein
LPFGPGAPVDSASLMRAALLDALFSPGLLNKGTDVALLRYHLSVEFLKHFFLLGWLIHGVIALP